MAARLEEQAAEDAMVGYHLEQVFRLRHELGRPDVELGAQAGGLLRAAAAQAFRRSDLPATVSLLVRARALLPPADAAQLLPKLGQALFEAGRFAEADDVLAEAIEMAQADALLESRARVDQQFVRMHAESEGAIGEASRVVTAALQVFEEHGDDLGQCRAWRLQAWIEWTEGHATEADEAWRRAATHARAGGEERELFEILGWRASGTVEGPTPVVEAIQTCTEIREQVSSSPVAVAVTLQSLAGLHALQGEFDDARSLIREANAILEDVGRMQSAVSHHEAVVEMLAGDPAEAEERLHRGYERLEEMGEKALLATTAALLARATYAQERYREAERFCSVSESTAASEDVWTQVIWRGVSAKILARQGRIDEAEALAHEAVRLATQTDLLNRRGDALLDLAEVLSLGGRPADAEAAVREALELYARKGNVVSAGYARSLVATPAAT
jgi:tetratricopeptide (TPR) repeat protein